MVARHWGWLIVQIFVGLFLLAGCGDDHKQGNGKNGHHGDGAETTVKTDFDSYSAAVAAIDKQRAHVAELIEHEKLLELHKAAKPIQLIADKLAGLSLKEGSGVPQDSIKEVSRTARALAGTWAKIDEAGDAKDLAASKKVYQEMVDLIDTLKKYAKPVEAEHHEEKGHAGHND